MLSETDVLLSKDDYQGWFSKTHRGKEKKTFCYSLTKSLEAPGFWLKTGYCIGLDWLEPGKLAINVAPKLNTDEQQVDFVRMLLSALRHSEVAPETHNLVLVDWKSPPIQIEQKQDLLTPFLVAEFLGLLKAIVKKGLKRSYYSIDRNLKNRVKGKILVGKSVKYNLLQNKKLQNYCRYEEFGLNNVENRLLKKALLFVERYLSNYQQLANQKEIKPIFNYIKPAFRRVSDKFDFNELKEIKTNAFFKEYQGAVRLAKLIIRRFGYNVANTQKQVVPTPVFWIDMSKLFELYVLGLLKDRFQKQVRFQYTFYGNELDYLLKTKDYQMVIDAKYKPKYSNDKDDADIRQVSGYARLKKIYEELDVNRGAVIDCLIIYPDQENGKINLLDVNLKEVEIPHYFDVYKLGVKLPLMNESR